MYVWIYENRANFNTTILLLFQENTPALSGGSVSPRSLLTQTLLLSVGRGWAWLAKAVLQRKGLVLLTKMLSLCDPPTPLWIRPRGPAWYQLIARALACLTQPSLTEPSLIFEAAIACRQAKFCPKCQTYSAKICCSDICSRTLSVPRSKQFCENEDPADVFNIL